MGKAIRLTPLAILVLGAIFAFATGQQGDILFLDGKKHFIYTNPLRPFLDKNPQSLPKTNVISTANWRGYIATWKVKDDSLMLTDVEVLDSVSKTGEKSTSPGFRSVIASIFPGQKEILADWFTGNVIIPNGELVNYVHMGYASTYEKYILLRVEKGKVTRRWECDAAGFVKFREAQFAAYKKTDEYQKALAEAHKEGSMTPQENEEFLREYFSERYMSMIFDERR